MPETPEAEAEVIGRYAQQAATPHKIDHPAEPHIVMVPEGGTVKTLDLERYLPAPRRKGGEYHPATVASFVDYATAHRDPEHTTVWVDQLASRVVAVLNDHAPKASAWADHRVILELIKTAEWKHWLSQDGKYLSQEEFAEHLQDGIEEIRHPHAAEMLEIAQTIQGKTKADWKTAKRLDNGEVSFVYQEEVQASAGRQGHLEIPQQIVLGIAPFYGESPFELTARLRYRIREGDLRIGYRLDRPVDVVLAVLKGIADRLRDKAGFPNVYMGTPGLT